MTEFDYENDLAIDPHALDEEWLRHSQICMNYVKAAAEAQRKHSRLEEKLKVIKAEVKNELEQEKAELDHLIRKEPAKYDCQTKDKDGNCKPTETWISGAIIRSEKYRELIVETNDKQAEVMDSLIEAAYNLEIIKGASDTFAWQRKAALEGACALWYNGYFSIPNLPREAIEGKRIADVARDKVSDKQRTNLNKKKRVRRK